MARTLKFGSTTLGQELLSLTSALERLNAAAVPLVDSDSVAEEILSPVFHYKAVARIAVDKDTEDQLQAYLNGTLKPALVAAATATLSEWESLPTATLKRSMANARFVSMEQVSTEKTRQHNVFCRRTAFDLVFTSPSDITEVA
jgi:hypothetical protein